MKYQLVFTGWNESLKKVSFVSLLRDRAGMSFLSAKRVLEALLLGEETIIELPNQASAKELQKETRRLGTTSKIVSVRSPRRVLTR